MSDATEQKKARLERIARNMEELATKKTEIDRKLKEAKGRVKLLQRKLVVEENRKKRKAREREIFAYGGLCEIAGLGRDRQGSGPRGSFVGCPEVPGGSRSAERLQDAR